MVNKQGTAILTEGWALRPTKRAYRVSEKQKDYFTAKFNIGESTGRKVDASLVARYETCPWFEWQASFQIIRIFDNSTDYFIFHPPFCNTSPTDS